MDLTVRLYTARIATLRRELTHSGIKVIGAISLDCQACSDDGSLYRVEICWSNPPCPRVTAWFLRVVGYFIKVAHINIVNVK